MMNRPDWISDLHHVLDGVQQELANPTPGQAAFEDLKSMLDNVRTVLLAVIESRDVAEYVAALRDIRMQRANALLEAILADTAVGHITLETIGITELKDVLEEVAPKIDWLLEKRVSVCATTSRGYCT
jgi:hypothetical protein